MPRRRDELHIAEEGGRLRVEGALTAATAGELWRALEPRLAEETTVDLSGVDRLGTAGAAALAEGSERARAAGGALRVAAARPEHEQVLGHLVLPEHVPPAPRPPPFVEAVGAGTRRGFAGLGTAIRLTADSAVLAVTGLVTRGPRGRFAEAARLTTRYGAEGVPIVALLSLLLGLALGFQAAYQLRQFGASLFIANLVGLSVLRELGPVLTAVIVIGRTGSAITAELGTMVVREEVDALRVMGLDPVRFLVVPRLYALTVAVPALTLFANLAGIAGGLLIADFYLRISPSAYIHQTLRSVVPFDLLIGIFKSFLFAWVIAFVSVAYGLSPKRGAESVGQSTTASVVTAIFLLIVVDSTVTTVSTLWKGT